MGLKKQLEIILKTLFSNTLFHAIWLGCLFAFFYWHIDSFLPVFKVLYGNPYVWLFTAGFWFLVCWLCTFALNLIWPILLLVFFKTERLKNPKQIIQFGDRFRKLNLSTPQIYKMNDTQQVWKNRIRGFFALPSPFGALLLVGAEVIDKLTFEELDTWICRQVTESRFYRFSRPGMTFFTYVPTAGLLGFFCGELYFQNFNALIIAAFFVILAFFFWAQFQIQRIHNIDFRSVRIFHLNPETFFHGISVTYKKTFSDKILGLFGKPSVEQRIEWFNYKIIGLTDDINIPPGKPLYYRFLIPAVPIALAVLVNILIDGTYRQKISGDQLISALQSRGLSQKPSLPNLVALPTATQTAPPAAAPPIEAAVANPVVAATTNTPKITSLAEAKNADELAMKNAQNAAPAKKLDEPKTSAAVLATVAAEPVATSLGQIIQAGDMRGIIRLLGQGKSLRDGDPQSNGATPLLLALKKGDLEMVYLLLILGSQFSEIDTAGKSALIYAMESPTPLQTVAYVLRGNINVNYTMPDGTTALDWAQKFSATEVAELLASSGAKSRSPAQIKK